MPQLVADPPAYHAPPADARRGGLVLIPGLLGVDARLRAVADSFAADGYEVLIPAVLASDPAGPDEMEAARWGLDCVPAVQAAIDALQGPVFALGFGFGGTVAWLAAQHCEGLVAASCFYGGHIIRHLDQGLRCPVALHFGKRDPLVPQDDAARIAEARPDLPVWLYDAGHDFAMEGDGYDEDAARLAFLRTRQLFHRSGGARGEMGG